VTDYQDDTSGRDRFTERYADLVIRLGLLALFIYVALTLVRPFVSIIIWSVVIAVALYPAFEWIASRLGGRRRVAAVLTTALSLLVVIGPATWLVLGVIDSLSLLVEQLNEKTLLLPRPEESVRRWPVIGEQLFQFWDLAATNIKAALAKVAPHLRPLGHTLLQIAAGAGAGTLKFLAAVIIAGFLYVPGPALVGALKSFARRVAFDRGEAFIDLAGTTIRTVAQGVLGISALQAMLAGIGLAAAGISGASLLTTAILILGIIQIGPTIIILPIILWGWTAMDTTQAAIFTVYMLIVSALDNVLKPLIMRRGLNTPILVILIGVIGGTLSYGINGLFLGPIVLSVIWELTAAWVRSEDPEQTRHMESAGGTSSNDEAHPVHANQSIFTNDDVN
jgi:predicted PurR-regulated permease PerM